MHFDPECLRFCYFGFYICLPSKSHTPNTYYGSDTLFECFLTKNEIVLNSLQHSSTHKHSFPHIPNTKMQCILLAVSQTFFQFIPHKRGSEFGRVFMKAFMLIAGKVLFSSGGMTKIWFDGLYFKLQHLVKLYHDKSNSRSKLVHHIFVFGNGLNHWS